MAKISKPVIYLMVAAVGLSAYTFMSGPTTTGKSDIKAAERKSKSKKEDLFTKEDYEIQFARLDEPAKNAFTPLVARSSAKVAPGPDVIPPDFTGGDPNWVFTGTTDIDGRQSALFENKVTFESEFVSTGERWKNCTIRQISEGQVALSAKTGKHVTLELVSEFDDSMMMAGQSQAGMRPVNPALSGPIGGREFAVRPEEESRPRNRGRNTEEQPNAN